MHFNWKIWETEFKHPNIFGDKANGLVKINDNEVYAVINVYKRFNF